MQTREPEEKSRRCEKVSLLFSLCMIHNIVSSKMSGSMRMQQGWEENIAKLKTQRCES